jgi:hypothetical protein
VSRWLAVLRGLAPLRVEPPDQQVTG